MAKRLVRESLSLVSVIYVAINVLLLFFIAFVSS